MKELFMTLKEKIIGELKKEEYLSDRELTDKIYGTKAPQQSINQACRQLTAKGIINRTAPPIKNYLGNGIIPEPLQKITKVKPVFSKLADSQLQEEEIKHILNDYLIEDGWETKVAWNKAHGIDIEAFRGEEHWIIEVKGCGSRNAMRVNYFLAILGETLQRMNMEKARYSIALPDIQQYRNLWKRLPRLAKQRTEIDIIFVGSESKIEFLK